jgi:Xaa-Pro aminopeptidase
MVNNRISKARGCLERVGADLLIVSNLSNIRYLSGFTGSEALLILSPSEGWFLTDSRYTSQAADEVTGARVVEFSNRLDAVAGILKESGAGKIAFEAGYTSVSVYQELVRRVPGVEFVPADAELSTIRSLKDAAELATLEQVAAIASSAFQEIVGEIRPGALESEVAWALEVAMRRGGAEGKSFDFIVASGVRGALPHGRASDKVIAAGELVTVDFGAFYRGYCSDETVTVCLGVPDSRQSEVYETVRVAQQLAIEAIRPGISFKDVDAKARDYIGSKGFGQYFGHGLGHGIGLDVHEPPTASPRGAGVVEAGMVFTVEPGIYIPGWGGVRIEDSVVVERDGCRRITQVPKQLMIV